MENFREILAYELDQRSKNNPKYSLRAFARDIQIDPSRLSAILKGKQGPSLAYARSISKNLNFDEKKTQLFCTLVESLHSRSEVKKKLALKKLASLGITPSSPILLSINYDINISENDFSQAKNDLLKYFQDFVAKYNQSNLPIKHTIKFEILGLDLINIKLDN